MKTRSLLALVGLAISFALPTFAQQKDRGDAGIVQQRDLVGVPKALGEFSVLWMKEDEAYNNNNAAALAPLFTEDAVLMAPDGMFFGRQAIEKRYVDAFQQSPITTFSQGTYGLNAIDNAVWSVGEWWGTLQGETGPVLVRGYESALHVPEANARKIRFLTLTGYGPCLRRPLRAANRKFRITIPLNRTEGNPITTDARGASRLNQGKLEQQRNGLFEAKSSQAGAGDTT